MTPNPSQAQPKLNSSPPDPNPSPAAGQLQSLRRRRRRRRRRVDARTHTHPLPPRPWSSPTAASSFHPGLFAIGAVAPLPAPARAGQAACRSATATASSSSTTTQRLLARDPLLQFGGKEGEAFLARSGEDGCAARCTTVMMGIHSCCHDSSRRPPRHSHSWP
ncbi:uncharacterized protein LOC119292432 [Triticum dicoccoides]|uniref:uncharacterized protein LOC119292432 n=1 Tax=Triticum dicoccoides TaxID=85692 RepID=UPI00188E4AE7|nr:uncharacterized protein LOC119292432 [Triticum dicoccoides]